MRFITQCLIVVVLLAGCTASKQIAKPDTLVVNNLKTHISFLADDKLEGRRTGSAGEKLAMEYIADQFKSIGLTAKGTDNYFQSFEVYDGKAIGEATQFIINGNKLEAGKDFFPFPFSPNKNAEAQPAIALKEADMPWFYDLKDVLTENKNNPHFDLEDYIYKNAKKANERGASAVILYNSSTVDDKLVFNAKDRAATLPIPVFYIKKAAADKYFNDESATLDIRFKADIAEKKRTGHNVIGYIDNGAASTVIIGAHYDHLGYGEDGNSMIRNFDHPMIHNGADDNASGTAALIELARKLKTTKSQNNNYLFLAFSGEELGLFGSKYFVENPTINLKNVDYMINMDMVGRLNDSTNAVTIGGYGTSPTWGEYFSNLPTDKQSFVFKYDSSGTGPSDHTSFYRKDIPVLFYFTGLHTDYHKPTDDADKINYTGEARIIQHIYTLVQSLNTRGKLAFTKTRETQATSGKSSFKVSMGIMPDYTYTGTGLRADGVTPDRPAIKAGLKAGDIILQIGDIVVNSMDNYMQALGAFNKGDKVKVKYKRGNEVVETTVEF